MPARRCSPPSESRIGGTAAAQRAGRLQQILEHAQELRGEAARGPEHDPDPRRPATIAFSFAHDGITREYLVHVPKSYRGAPTPMLVALHGGGGDADFQADDSKYELISKSEAAGFIAVFPNGYSRFPSGALATWNAGSMLRRGAEEQCRRCRVHPRGDPPGGAPGEASIRSRVFATGMSNGAMMSWRLACEAPEIRAIAPVEGTDNTRSCKPSHPVAVIQFHAADDHQRAVRRRRRRGPVAYGLCLGAGKPGQMDPPSIARRRRRSACLPCRARAATFIRRDRGGAPVELCVTDTGGHSWPGGGTQQGRKQPSMAISANDLMWQFFTSLK